MQKFFCIYHELIFKTPNRKIQKSKDRLEFHPKKTKRGKRKPILSIFLFLKKKKFFSSFF